MFRAGESCRRNLELLCNLLLTGIGRGFPRAVHISEETLTHLLADALLKRGYSECGLKKDSRRRRVRVIGEVTSDVRLE